MKTLTQLSELASVASTPVSIDTVTTEQTFAYYTDGKRHIAHSDAVKRVLAKRDITSSAIGIEGYYEITDEVMQLLLDICKEEMIVAFTDSLRNLWRIQRGSAKTQKIHFPAFKTWKDLPQHLYEKISRWASEYGHTLEEHKQNLSVYYFTIVDEIKNIGKRFYLRIFRIGKQWFLKLETVLFSAMPFNTIIEQDSPRFKGLVKVININNELSFY